MAIRHVFLHASDDHKWTSNQRRRRQRWSRTGTRILQPSSHFDRFRKVDFRRRLMSQERRLAISRIRRFRGFDLKTTMPKWSRVMHTWIELKTNSCSSKTALHSQNKGLVFCILVLYKDLILGRSHVRLRSTQNKSKRLRDVRKKRIKRRKQSQFRRSGKIERSLDLARSLIGIWQSKKHITKIKLPQKRRPNQVRNHIQHQLIWRSYRHSCEVRETDV